MKICSKSIIIILFCPIIYTSIAGQSKIKESLSNNARGKIKAFVNEQNIVGLSIAVSKDGEIFWSKGFGYTDKEKSKPVVPDETMFRIASLSKPITSTGMGVLMDRRVMHLDSSLYKYVPDFPIKKYDFTIGDLATHRAGIRHYNSGEFKNKLEMSLEEGISIFKKDKLKFEPGTEYLYSSYGYNLLGLAIQKAVKQPYEVFIYENVLRPLEMMHTIPDNGEYGEFDVTGFFKGKSDKVVEHGKASIFFKTPSGGYLSTAEDLTRLGDAMLDTKLLSRETLNLILTVKPLPNKNTNYAAGWGISKDKNKRTYFGHSGGGIGAVSRINVYPEEGLSIVMLSNTNCDYAKLSALVREVADIFLE